MRTDLTKDMGQERELGVSEIHRNRRTTPAAMADDELACEQPGGSQMKLVEGKRRRGSGVYMGEEKREIRDQILTDFDPNL